MIQERFKWETRGKACPGNVVMGEKYRFTLLTTRLIRIEYSEDGIFEDRATQSFFYRDFDQNAHSVKRGEGILTIETRELLLTYVEESPLAADTLDIRLKQYPGRQWHFGETAEQLKGTACTLDNTNGTVPLEDGIISREGYALIDDSKRMVLTEDGWFDVRPEGITDLYFFGYGHAYLECLQDFYRLTGRSPLLPDYALGNWWSRFHAYTQEEYCQLMERFEQEEIPFSVAVVDMDWHEVEDVPEHRIPDERFVPGWTGYTWNKKLFPNYRAFLRFLRKHHLRTALNLHPAQGVGCREAMYEQMAEACGIDPKSEELIRFDCLDPDFMKHYFDILHHPYEEEGVDFWWMDWQQGTDYWWVHDKEHPASSLEQMDPLWLLNHLHIMDISRNGKRPMFFSRYSGIGSHRYPVGFSGDTVISWESLDFQPYFTANASNVGYGWWSHDIGGHMEGYRDDELVIRWMQLGVFSPINRLHSSNSEFAGKEPWNLQPYEAETAKNWLRLRHRMFPYLYTMNFRHHRKLIPLILPMYYEYPEKDAAYRCRNQYLFGSELMVCPITKKNDLHTYLGKTKLWLPEGTWIDVFNGLIYQGERELDVYRNLEQMPVFARAGAIVPMEKYTGDNRLGNKDAMELFIFAGADGKFEMYEDEGDFDGYRKGVSAVTQMKLEWGNQATFTIHAAEGDHTFLPKRRSWTVRLRGVGKPETVELTVGKEVKEVEFTYDSYNATVCVCLDPISITKDLQLRFVSGRSLLSQNESVRERIFQILLHAQMSYRMKAQIWDAIQNENRPELYRICGEEEYTALSGAIHELLSLEF